MNVRKGFVNSWVAGAAVAALLFNTACICHFSQIAELNPTAAHNVGEEVGLPGRVEGWIAQAKAFTADTAE